MAWDNTKPADNRKWDLAAGDIRDNWDYMETIWGVDLLNANPVLNVMLPPYNAIGDGVADDTNAIQDAIDDAVAAGGGLVYLPSGNYLKQDALFIGGDNVTICGDGVSSIISNDPTVATEFNGISVTNQSNVSIRNLQLDGRVDERSGTDNAKGGIFINDGCQGCVIDNVLLKDFGHHTTSGGNYITLQNTEAGARITSGNRVTNCRIEDSGTGNFGIRVTSEWDVDVVTGALVGFCRDNIIENNTVIGCGFNAIEIAGPSTIYNRISGNQSIGCLGNTGIEADKGASYNRFSDNSVVDAVFSSGENGAGFRDQGFTGGTFPPTSDRVSIGNVWVNNTVRKCTQEAGQSFVGMLINNSNGCSVSNLTIIDNTPDVPATFAEMYGVQIFEANNIRLSNIYIRDMLDGVRVNEDVTGLDVVNADIVAFTAGSSITYTDDITAIILTGCRFDGGANGVSMSTTSKTITGGTITGCQFFNQTNAGIRLNLGSQSWIGNIDGNYFDSSIANSADVRVDDWSKFTFNGNNHASGFVFGSEERAFITGNLRIGGSTNVGDRANTWDDAAPTAGTWVVGDKVWNNDPDAGEFIGWICVAAPLTFKGFGAIEA